MRKVLAGIVLRCVLSGCARKRVILWDEDDEDEDDREIDNETKS